MDEKKDPSRSVAGDNDEPAALDKGKVEREVEDGPDSTEREFDPASAAEDAKITFPDGGVRAWFVVAGALVSLVEVLGTEGSEGREVFPFGKRSSSHRSFPRTSFFSLRAP